MKKFAALAMLVLAGLVLPGSASATLVTCTVTGVTYDTGHQLRLTCGGSVYHMNLTNATPACNQGNLDDQKMIQSLAVSALLSAKQAQMDYTSMQCAGGVNPIRLINWLQLLSPP